MNDYSNQPKLYKEVQQYYSNSVNLLPRPIWTGKQPLQKRPDVKRSILGR